MTDVFCNQCGHRNPPGSRFCSSCGSALAPVQDDHTERFETVEAVPASLVPGGAALLVTSGHRAGTRFELASARVTAGRHPDSDIFLDDITVSRRHVEMVHRAGEWEVHDVGSLNGTYVNGERVEQAVVANGDEVQIGKFKLVFVQRVAE